MTQKTVAVVTSTIGRPELIRAIESVRNQTYPCKHYIFVDGEQFHEKVREIVKPYSNIPNIIVTYLPMNTGADGWINSFINAAAPFLVKEDILCYLDDDNWYDPEHIGAIAEAFNQHNVDMAFNLRKLYDNEGNFLCEDNVESIGFWYASDKLRYIMNYKGESVSMETQLHRTNGHIDTNCLGFSLETARQLANEWTAVKYCNDHRMLSHYFSLNKPSFCTGKRTVNYVVNFNQFVTDISSILNQFNWGREDEYPVKKLMIKGMNSSISPELHHWLKPTLFHNNQLTVLEE